MYPIRLFIKNPIILWTTALAILLNIVAWIALAAYIKPQTENVFLHYTTFIGVDFVGQWWQVFAVPLFGVIVLLANLLLADLVFLKEKLLGFILAFTNTLVHIFLGIATFLIISWNV